MYNTGGKVAPTHSDNGEGAKSCSVEGASVGSSNGPNTGQLTVGGNGSKGTASKSTPSK